MSKRLSDSEVWKKSWFYDLEPKFKLFWFYILSDCDAAGIWAVNLKLAENIIGAKYEPEILLDKFKLQIIVINGGSYWFIVDFIKFQYGYPVSETAKMRKKLVDLLAAKNIDLDTLYDKLNTVSIGYQYSINTVKDKDKVIDKDIVTNVPKLKKKEEPPICESDLTESLKSTNADLYIIAEMLLLNCPNVMAMKYPMSLDQLRSLLKKFPGNDVIGILKDMENKGIKYLNSKGQYTYLTAEKWLNINKTRANVR
jgi:hypothetical protein